MSPLLQDSHFSHDVAMSGGFVLYGKPKETPARALQRRGLCVECRTFVGPQILPYTPGELPYCSYQCRIIRQRRVAKIALARWRARKKEERLREKEAENA